MNLLSKQKSSELPNLKANWGGALKNKPSQYKRILGIMLIAICFLAIGSVSFAYFATSTQKKELESTITTAKVSVRFADNDNGVSGELKFGESITKKFLIENTGTTEARVNMFWDRLVNSFLSGSLTYTLSYITKDGSAVPVISDALVPRSKEPSRQNLAEDLIIPVGATVEYELTVTLNRLEDVNQESDLSAVFYSNFWAEDSRSKIPENMIMAIGWDYNNKMWTHKSDITKVIFETTMNPKENAVYTYDISSAQDKTVMSYLVSDGNAGYIAYIQTEGEAIANPNSSCLFRNFNNLETIEGLDYLNTKNVIAMYDMFHNCEKLTSLDLSNFDTSKVTNMGHMFTNCNSLTELNISNFDTKNVQYMDNMFNGCSSLKVLDISSFNTDNVISMSYMFAVCERLKNLDLSNFNTRNVTDMAGMFTLCYSLSELDISSFDTKNVTTMHRMFNQCTSLEVIDMTNFDLSNVVDTSMMFSMWWNDSFKESKLQIIKFPNKSTTLKLTTMADMFSGCTKLKNIDLSSFNTSNVTSMAYMFNSCGNLTSIIFSDNFVTNKVTDMSSMFSYCNILTSLDVSNFDTSKVTSMYRMFAGCSSLTSLDVSNFNTSNVTNMSSMFSGCSSLTSLDLSSFDTSKVTTVGGSQYDSQGMFYNCTSLQTLNLSNFNTSSITESDNVFNSISSTVQITINDATIKQWILDNSSLTESNIVTV